MRSLVWVLVFVIFAILQSTVLNYLTIFGIKPDILLVGVIFYALSEGSPGFGLCVGILGGLLGDLLSGGVFGVGIFCFSLLGITLGYLGRRVYIDTLPIQLVVTFPVAIVTFTFYYLISALFRGMPPLWDAFRFVVFSASVYTTLVSPLIFRILRKLPF